jgi:hypothetical protein
VPSSVGIKEVSRSIKNGWIAQTRCLQNSATTLRQIKNDSGNVVRCGSKLVVLIELF